MELIDESRNDTLHSAMKTNEVDELRSDSEQEICFHCLEANTPGSNFCSHCQTPLTAYANTGPMERVYAMGDFARKVSLHPKRWIRWSGILLVIVVVVAILSGMLLP